MNTKKSPQSHLRQGFTLIELMTVITIIIILAGMSLGAFSWANRKASVEKARAQLRLLENGIQQYHADVGAYPEANGTGNIKKGGDDSLLIYQMCFGDGVGEDGVASAGEALDGAPDEGATVYINELDPNAGAKAGWFDKTPVPTKLLDPWGRAWYYRSGTADALNPDFDLWSIGIDPSRDKDSDDITNW